MRVSREQSERNRAAIVDAAARLFRERGIDQVSVAEVTAAAGLTHGGFYGHFKNKDALVAEASAHAVQELLTLWAKIKTKAHGDVDAVIERYLSDRHRKEVSRGCLYAALGSEIARAPQEVRNAATESLKAQIAALCGDEGKPQRSREEALAALATMVGALTLARMVDDPALSAELLSSARSALLERS